MTQHEYISIAIAIILGLAITRLLHTVAMIIRAQERVVFHWSSAAWAFCIMLYILQFWWVGWGLRTVDEWSFQNFIVLVFGCTFLYGAAEMALSVPAEEKYDMLQQSQQLGRLSALSMLLYFLVGPYVNIAMYNNAVMPSVAVPSAGILLMLLTIFFPARFTVWSALFVCYTIGILMLTI
ncbi:MAG: hypothetical protein Q7W55_12750 [Pseudohongiella sp.]|nr:hypothetical protein [Pseudohongiella sp.]MDO9519957.1 hypothetical protein [Pseudohongiella sp.]MDP2127120.1 hypothetical protein [Pseudohongiella sp.]